VLQLQMEGFVKCRGVPQAPKYQPLPLMPTVYDCPSQPNYGILSTWCPTCDSGSTVMGSGVGVPSNFQSSAILDIVL
jgi:hypothetical protein